MRQSSVKTFNKIIRRFAKIVNLYDTEAVKDVIANLNVDENTKVTYCTAFDAFYRFIEISWKRPKYQYSHKLPEFLPEKEELDNLIAGSGPKLGPLLQLIVETGMRLNEALSLTWICINFNNQIITLTKAEKHSLPRVFNVSTKLLGMLGNLSRKNDKIFGKMTDVSAESCIKNARRNVAKKVSNPRIAKIHFHLIRHYYGTMLYHRKPDIFYVSKMLGHKSVLTTQIYINLEQMMFSGTTNEYIGMVATTQAEKLKAIESGFDFVSADADGTHYFRKRK